jgi:hypothetical protein
MIRECFKARTGVLFSATKLAELGIEPSSLYPDVRARPDVKAVIQGSQTIRVIEAPGWVPWAKSFLTTGSKHTPKTVLELTLPNMSEEELDARDAFAPLYDQLVIQSATWQAMESFFYTKKSVYDATADTFKDVLHQHNGAGRSIPPAESTHGGKIRVHRTVQMRMQGTYENGPDKGKQYIPKARMGWQQEFEDKTPFEHVGADLIEWVSYVLFLSIHTSGRILSSAWLHTIDYSNLIFNLTHSRGRKNVQYKPSTSSTIQTDSSLPELTPYLKILHPP